MCEWAEPCFEVPQHIRLRVFDALSRRKLVAASNLTNSNCVSGDSNPQPNSDPETLMYLPSSFVQDDQNALHGFLEANSFGVLVTQGTVGSTASHLPFLLDRNAGPQGTLIGHVARANPQWKDGEGTEALAIFSGPHAYISPTWYQVELAVPTWNYIAVHAYGRLTWIEDAVVLREIVDASVDRYERSQPVPWKLNAPQDFVDKLLAQIVGFRLEITRLEGKWKLNQNHPVERRERVISALRAQDREDSRAIADAMDATLR